MKNLRPRPWIRVWMFGFTCLIAHSACSSKPKVNVQVGGEAEPVFDNRVDNVALRWFDKLKAGEVHQAVLDTVDPVRSFNISPHNKVEIEAIFGGDRLPDLRGAEFTRFLERNGSDVEVTPLGLRGSEQTDYGARYLASYRLKSVEGEFQVDLTVERHDPKGDREPFGWTIPFSELKFTPKAHTAYSHALRNMQDEAANFSQRWIEQLVSGQKDAVYRATLPAADRADAKLPGDDALFAELMRRGFFTPSEPRFGFLTEAEKARLREAWDLSLVLRAGASGLSSPELSPQIKISPPEIRCTFPLEVALPKTGGGFKFVAGRLVVVSTRPELLAELNRLRKTMRYDEAGAMEGSLSALPKRAWRVARLEIDSEYLSRRPPPFHLGDENWQEEQQQLRKDPFRKDP